VISVILGVSCLAHAGDPIEHRGDRTEPESSMPNENQAPPIALPEGARKVRELYVTANGLAAFKAALLEKEKEGVRVIQYGASHTRGGSFVREIRNLLAEGQTSPGWVGPRYPYNWDAYVDSYGDWTHEKWLNREHRGPFGPTGVAFISSEPGASLEVELKGQDLPEEGIELQVLYESKPGHLPFTVQSGGDLLAEVTSVEPQNPEEAYRVARVILPKGARIARITVGQNAESPGASLRLFGLTIDIPQSALRWDALGVNGSRGKNLLERGDSAVEQYLQEEKPHMIVLWYGTNSVVDDDLDLEEYASKFGALIERLRTASPHASCLIIGTTDLARNENSCFMTPRERKVMQRRRKSKRQREYLRRNRNLRVCDPNALVRKRGRRERFPVPEVRNRTEWEAYIEQCRHRTPNHLPDFVARQRSVALEKGCAFFDVFEFMGGRESIVQWACATDPRLAAMDLVHLTGDGYRMLARGLFSTLMEAMYGLQPPLETPTP
jgi:lysophospholipase L1-like esterase